LPIIDSTSTVSPERVTACSPTSVSVRPISVFPETNASSRKPTSMNSPPARVMTIDFLAAYWPASSP